MDKTDSQLRKMTIDQDCFRLAFGRDVDYHDDYPQANYLDLETGDVIWVAEDDEDADMEGIPAADNRADRERIAAAPKRYLEIPGLHHGDHHKILQEFTEPDSSNDENSQGITCNPYFGSIGGWIKSEDHETVNDFMDFRYHRTVQMAEEFLRENGIDPGWK